MTAETVDPVALIMVGLGGQIIDDKVDETLPQAEPDRPVEPRRTIGPPTDPISDMAPDPFAVSIDERLRSDIASTIVEYARTLPRNLQVAIGPSEVGHPCARHLAYKLLDWPAVNDGGDVLPSLVGTWAHTGLDVVFGDPKHGGRYIVNQELEAWPGMGGHGDCYDTATQTVIDWKFKGPDAMREVRKGIITEQYRVQLHTYGLGWENLGYPVRHVADAFFSRGGFLLGKYGLHMHVEDYDRTIALKAKQRLENVLVATSMLDVETTPANWAELPATPVDCHFCPWHRPGSTDLSVACPGDSATAEKKETA